MKKVLIAAVLAVLAGGVYAADFGDLRVSKLADRRDGSPVVSETAPQMDAAMKAAINYAKLATILTVTGITFGPGLELDSQEISYNLGDARGSFMQLKQLLQTAGCKPAGVDMKALEDKIWGLSGYIFPKRVGPYMVPTGNKEKMVAQVQEISAELAKIRP